MSENYDKRSQVVKAPSAARAGRRGSEPEVSAIGRGLVLLGDQWTLLILQRAFLLHIRRFAGWRDSLGVSESVLAGRLRELVANGLLVPTPYRERGRTHREYRLTEPALELWVLLVAAWSWERRWVPRQAALPDLVHKRCGRVADAYLTCAACGEAVTARDTETTRGSRATFASASPPRVHRRSSRDALADDGLSWFPETMEILGDRWSTSVLAAAFLAVRRFSDFQRELGLAPSLLADRLRRFVAFGVLEPIRLEPGRRRAYHLTEKGLAFFPVFATLVDWSQRNLPAPPDTSLIISHRCCGAVLRPALGCTRCREPLDRRDVRFRSKARKP